MCRAEAGTGVLLAAVVLVPLLTVVLGLCICVSSRLGQRRDQGIGLVVREIYAFRVEPDSKMKVLQT